MHKGNSGEFRPLVGVDYSKVLDRQVGDKRFEREKPGAAFTSSSSSAKPVAFSSTYDAFQRLAIGIDGRTLAEKIADPNRPTWEQYKQDNGDKLNMIGADVKKMAEYRQQLDREREERLRLGRHFKSDSHSEVEESDSDTSQNSQKKSKKRKREKKEKKTSKKSKKEQKSHKKHKKSKGESHDKDRNSSESED